MQNSAISRRERLLWNQRTWKTMCEAHRLLKGGVKCTHCLSLASEAHNAAFLAHLLHTVPAVHSTPAVAVVTFARFSRAIGCLSLLSLFASVGISSQSYPFLPLLLPSTGSTFILQRVQMVTRRVEGREQQELDVFPTTRCQQCECCAAKATTSLADVASSPHNFVLLFCRSVSVNQWQNCGLASSITRATKWVLLFYVALTEQVDDRSLIWA